jgi:hypothetical protein
MLRRLVIMLAIAVVAAAAPARAWCEAACLAPTAESTPHCPTHQPAGDTATFSASSIDDCPILEAARPPLHARLDLHAVVGSTQAPALNARTPVTPSLVRPHSASSVFERCTPLRI